LAEFPAIFASDLFSYFQASQRSVGACPLPLQKVAIRSLLNSRTAEAIAFRQSDFRYQPVGAVGEELRQSVGGNTRQI
jgi:hypothetical protein